MPGTRPGMTALIGYLIRQSTQSVSSAWTTDIVVQRTPFCERLCPIVTIGKKLHRQIIVIARPQLEIPSPPLAVGRDGEHRAAM
jgi:hypothetical protein